MTTFSILEFPRAEGAAYMLRSLRKLQEQHLIQIEDGAILTWPLGSKMPRIKQLSPLCNDGALSGAFWGLLVGLLCAVPFFGTASCAAIRALSGQFARYGIDERFIKRVRNQIMEGTSALFLITNGPGIENSIAPVKCMPFGFISTDLSPEQEKLLYESFWESSRTEILTDWREEYAYTLGLQAYIYGFPWVLLPQLRWQWLCQPATGERASYAALNHFWHAQALPDATYPEKDSPNNDIMYSIAWVNVRDEPVILSHPDMGERYYVFQLASLDADNFAYVGTRSTGQHAGHYAIAGPSWQGRLPADVNMLQPSRTPSVLVFGHTQVDGPEDRAAVQELQKRYRLTPLSLWKRPHAPGPENPDVWPPFDTRSDPLAVWKTMNRAMSEEPPPARHAALLKLFATIGIGPHQQVERLDTGSRRGLVRAAASGQQLIEAVVNQERSGKRVNGWRYPPATLGQAGQHDDFITRAALQCADAIIALDLQEAVNLIAERDSDDRPLTGTCRYCLNFTPQGLPEVDAFWSITMYSVDHHLVKSCRDSGWGLPDSIVKDHQGSIGSRTPGLVYDPDGGLTFFIQHEPPENDRLSNWLPAPRGPFNLILSAYLPGRAIVEQTWEPPALEVLPQLPSQRQRRSTQQ